MGKGFASLRSDATIRSATGREHFKLCEKGGVWKALQLFARMQQAEVHASATSLNSTVSACEKGEESENALQLFAQMQRYKVKLDTISYSVAIRVQMRY